MRADRILYTGLALALLAAVPSFGPFLEARLPTHLLVQYPLIVAGGVLIGARLAHNRPMPWTAAPMLVGAVLVLAFWFLPRWIDASLADPATDAVKVACLFLGAGVPLGWGWMQAGAVLRGFLVANAAAMLGVMGWLLLAVPSRLCNAYLLPDQRLTGMGFAGLAAVIVALAFLSAVTGSGAGELPDG